MYVHIAVPSNKNIRKQEKLEKYQRLKKELGMWKIKAIVALGSAIPRLEKWLQQIPRTATEISVQKSALLGTAKTAQSLTLPVLRYRTRG